MKGMAKEAREGVEAVEAGTDWRPAVVPTLALITVGVLPGLLKGLYEPFTANLMAAYVTGGMLFIGAVVGGLSGMIFRDLSSRRMKIFRLAPDQTHVSGADGLVRIESSEDLIERR
jgi:hypothetical protein